MSTRALKPLGHARAWFVLWLAGIAAVVAVCLLPSSDIPRVPEGMDKLEHAGAFALLAAAAVQLFARRGALAVAAGGLLLLGIAIELAQGAFAPTRSMDAWDALADAAGVAIGLASLAFGWRDLLLRIDPPRD